MVFSTASVSGTFSSSIDLDAGQLLQRGGALRVRLVVAVVVARADIDEADRGVRREGRATPAAAPRVRAAAPPATNAVVKSCQNPLLAPLADGPPHISLVAAGLAEPETGCRKLRARAL